MKKPKILVICDYYLPGYKSGGGMRTIVNMVDRLKDKFDFWIITRDHDGKLDKRQYSTVNINKWNEVRGAQVFYLAKESLKVSKLRELILQVQPDSIYLNSFFATPAIYALKLRKLRLIPNINIILAPCGELSKGALQLKSRKKQLFINISKITGLYQNVIWKASTELEKREIEQFKGKGGKIFIAPDLPPKMIFEEYSPDLKPPKKAGEARMIFFSRFMRKKNFRWLLEYLPGIKGNLIIDVFGPIEDEVYWNECLKIIESLPPNIKIEAKGAISHEKANETLVKYHFFILPTLGENFGHVFLEALASGCPLIISDRTPWLDLKNRGIGWDLPLEKPETWVEVLNECVNMDNLSFVNMSLRARTFLLNWLAGSEIEENTLSVLNFSLSKAEGKAA